jgi:hypothetical protein
MYIFIYILYTFWGLCALWLTLRFFTIFLLFFTKNPVREYFRFFAHFFLHFSRSGNFFYFVIEPKFTLFLLKFHALMSHVCTGFFFIFRELRQYFFEVCISLYTFYIYPPGVGEVTTRGVPLSLEYDRLML